MSTDIVTEIFYYVIQENIEEKKKTQGDIKADQGKHLTPSYRKLYYQV